MCFFSAQRSARQLDPWDSHDQSLITSKEAVVWKILGAGKTWSFSCDFWNPVCVFCHWLDVLWHCEFNCLKWGSFFFQVMDSSGQSSPHIVGIMGRESLRLLGKFSVRPTPCCGALPGNNISACEASYRGGSCVVTGLPCPRQLRANPATASHSSVMGSSSHWLLAQALLFRVCRWCTFWKWVQVCLAQKVQVPEHPPCVPIMEARVDSSYFLALQHLFLTSSLFRLFFTYLLLSTLLSVSVCVIVWLSFTVCVTMLLSMSFSM